MNRLPMSDIRDLKSFVADVGGRYATMVDCLIDELLRYRQILPPNGKYQVAAWDCTSFYGKHSIVRAKSDEKPAGFRSAEPLYRIHHD